MPSELYVGEETLDALHTAMVADLRELYETGFSALDLHRILSCSAFRGLRCTI